MNCVFNNAEKREKKQLLSSISQDHQISRDDIY